MTGEKKFKIPEISDEEVSKMLKAMGLGNNYAADADVEELRTEMDAAVREMREMANKMSGLKYTTVQIAGAPFDMSVVVPGLSLDEILDKVGIFYKKMFGEFEKQNTFKAAVEDGGSDYIN